MNKKNLCQKIVSKRINIQKKIEKKTYIGRSPHWSCGNSADERCCAAGGHGTGSSTHRDGRWVVQIETIESDRQNPSNGGASLDLAISSGRASAGNGVDEWNVGANDTETWSCWSTCFGWLARWCWGASGELGGSTTNGISLWGGSAVTESERTTVLNMCHSAIILWTKKRRGRKGRERERRREEQAQERKEEYKEYNVRMSAVW